MREMNVSSFGIVDHGLATVRGNGGKIRAQEAEENDDVAYGSVGRHVNT